MFKKITRPTAALFIATAMLSALTACESPVTAENGSSNASTPENSSRSDNSSDNMSSERNPQKVPAASRNLRRNPIRTAKAKRANPGMGRQPRNSHAVPARRATRTSSRPLNNWQTFRTSLGQPTINTGASISSSTQTSSSTRVKSSTVQECQSTAPQTC